MRVLIPFVPGKLRVPSLVHLVAELVDVSSDDEAYGRALLARLGPPLIVVEQDMAPTMRDLQDLWKCPMSWCIAPYRGPGGLWLDQSLGCTKLGPLARVPTIDEMGHDREPFAPLDWRRLDVRLAAWLRGHHVQRHVHGLAVAHLHNYTKE